MVGVGRRGEGLWQRIVHTEDLATNSGVSRI